MTKISLLYGEYFHIYNRGNNGEILFRESENYKYFLTLYAKYINPIADTLAYCLMPNHFHFVVRIKEEMEIKPLIDLDLFEKNKDNKIAEKKPKPENQFSHLFNSYSKAINKKYHRTGSLFEHTFKRRLIETENYLQCAIAYTHFNPVKADLSRSITDYLWSSYNEIILEKSEIVNLDLALTIFGEKDYFMLYHGKPDQEIYSDYQDALDKSQSVAVESQRVEDV